MRSSSILSYSRNRGFGEKAKHPNTVSAAARRAGQECREQQRERVRSLSRLEREPPRRAEWAWAVAAAGRGAMFSLCWSSTVNQSGSVNLNDWRGRRTAFAFVVWCLMFNVKLFYKGQSIRDKSQILRKG